MEKANRTRRKKRTIKTKPASFSRGLFMRFCNYLKAHTLVSLFHKPPPSLVTGVIPLTGEMAQSAKRVAARLRGVTPLSGVTEVIPLIGEMARSAKRVAARLRGVVAAGTLYKRTRLPLSHFLTKMTAPLKRFRVSGEPNTYSNVYRFQKIFS